MAHVTPPSEPARWPPLRPVPPPPLYPKVLARQRAEQAVRTITAIGLGAAAIATFSLILVAQDKITGLVFGMPLALLDFLVTVPTVLVLWMAHHNRWSPEKKVILLLVGLSGPVLSALSVLLLFG